MNAFIPHNDTVFFLNNLQKDFIKSLNEFNSFTLTAIPLFPTMAFFNEDFFSDVDLKNLQSCTIEKIIFEEEKFIFPVTLNFVMNSQTVTKILNIKFAQLYSENLTTSEAENFCKNIFTYQDDLNLPRTERIFKLASVETENNSWKIFDEKWVKVRK